MITIKTKIMEIPRNSALTLKDVDRLDESLCAESPDHDAVTLNEPTRSRLHESLYEPSRRVVAFLMNGESHAGDELWATRH